MPETLVLLHGFAGTHRTWDGVLGRLDPERYRALALDLPGHGEHGEAFTPDPPGEGARVEASTPITFEGCVRDVLARSPARFVLCGYSLGARIALHVALASPARVSRLVLVAGSPGIEDPGERAERRASDRRLADELERAPYQQFVQRWCAQAMFVADPPAVRALARADYLRNRSHPRTIAAVLRGVGTGEMASLWDRLAELRMPVAVLAGERDAKFQALARRMVELLPDAELRLVPGGHRLPLESPAGVASALA